MQEKSEIKNRFPNLLVDGYNLIHAIPEIARTAGSDLARAREILLIKLANYAFKKGIKIVVIFDGKNVGLSDRVIQKGLEINFTRDEKADKKIKAKIESLAHKTDWQVITSDFDLRYFAECRGVKHRTSTDFASELLTENSQARKARKEQKVSLETQEKKVSKEDNDWAYEIFLGKKK